MYRARDGRRCGSLFVSVGWNGMVLAVRTVFVCVEDWEGLWSSRVLGCHVVGV